MDNEEIITEEEPTESEEQQTSMKSSIVAEFIEFLKTGQGLASSDKLAVSEMNNKQQDLLHDLEIPDKLYVRDITHLGKELRNLRRERRKVKDELLIAEVIDSFLKSHPTIIDDLQKLLSDMEREEKFLIERTYTVKSSLITTTAMINKKLKDEENKTILIMNKILKKWSPNYEAVYENCETSLSGVPCYTFNFSLTNSKYDYSAAKSTLSNFRQIIEKELLSIHSSVVVDMSLSTMTLDNPDHKTTRLMAQYKIDMDNNSLHYLINGAVNFKRVAKRPTSKKPQKKKKKH